MKCLVNDYHASLIPDKQKPLFPCMLMKGCVLKGSTCASLVHNSSSFMFTHWAAFSFSKASYLAFFSSSIANTFSYLLFFSCSKTISLSFLACIFSYSFLSFSCSLRSLSCSLMIAFSESILSFSAFSCSFYKSLYFWSSSFSIISSNFFNSS